MSGSAGRAFKYILALSVLATAGGVAVWTGTHGGFWLALEHAGFLSSGSSATADAQPASRDRPAQRAQRGGGADQSIAVEVAEARAAKTTSDIRAIGSLQSDESVQIAPEISGRISEVVFEEGKAVKKGAVLVKLDDALAAAEVADADARLTLASANNDRARALSKTGNVTGRGRDEATANFETAQAAADLSKTRLAKHILVAPFDGIAGVRLVSVGAFVSAGTAITNLEKIDVLKVDFKVPEIYLEAIKVGQPIELNVDAIPGQSFDATIYAINPLLDVNGRALQVRARLDNKDARLRPGLFARITVKGLSPRDVVLIPEAAVLPRGGEAYVYLVDQGKAVERRVKLGQRANADVEVLEGIDARAVVVTAGQQKLRDGARIEVLPAAKDAVRPGTSNGPSNDTILPARAAADGRSG